MKKDRIDIVIKIMDEHQYVFLILSLVLTMVLYPFVVGTFGGNFWIHFFMSMVLLSGLYAANSHDKFVFLSLFLGIFTLVFSWIDYAIMGSYIITLIYFISGLAFFVFVTYGLIINLNHETKVNHELIYGAIAGYIMIGLMGAYLFAIIEILVPGSFSVPMGTMEHFPEFIYYSFVNLTTLGYGDIVPVSAHAQSRSVLFTISGQMYLMILVGVIVGKYITEINKTKFINELKKE